MKAHILGHHAFTIVIISLAASAFITTAIYLSQRSELRSWHNAVENSGRAVLTSYEVNSKEMGQVKGVYAGGLVINHSSTDASSIPLSYLNTARNIDVLFDHKSIGINILDGLRDLGTSNPLRYSVNITSDPSQSWYVSESGIGDFTLGEDSKPMEKMNQFTNVIEAQGYGNSVNVGMLMLNFLDNTDSGANLWNEYEEQMNYLEDKYKNTVFVWWTMPITTTGDVIRDDFNARVRSYAMMNNKVLFDIADIQSHAPNIGQVTKNNGNEAMCQDFTGDGMHLNSKGSQAAANAWWHLMAKLAGWNGKAIVVPTATPIPDSEFN